MQAWFLVSRGILSSRLLGTARLSTLKIGSVFIAMRSLMQLLTSEVISSLVNGQTLNEGVVLDEAEIASTRRLMLHVQTHDDPIMKIYLWDNAAAEFCTKFKEHESTPRVILVTTVNPKRFGGVLSLASMTSSRVFLDFDVQPTRDYVAWLDSNMEVANRVDATVVTKNETATISEILTYMKQVSAKVAWFECIATIDDVVHGAPWYYIGCGDCHTKATKGSTTLMCKKCGKSGIIRVPQYLANLSVYDSNKQAMFVLLGDAGQELTGKKASELVESYFEANESVGAEEFVPVPEALTATIGQTHRFIVKVSNHNLEGKKKSLTVTKVLPFVTPPPEAALEEEFPPNIEPALELDEGENGPSTVYEQTKDKRVKRKIESVDSEV